MWNENDAGIVAVVSVISSLKAKNPSKRKYCVRLSPLAKEKYSVNHLMTDLKRDDISLSGE